MLTLAKQVKFNPTPPFYYWNQIPKDVRCMIIKMAYQDNPDVIRVSQEFFRAIYEYQDNKKLIAIIFSFNYPRPLQYLSYQLVNLKKPLGKLDYTKYLVFEAGIVYKFKPSGINMISELLKKKKNTYFIKYIAKKNKSLGAYWLGFYLDGLFEADISLFFDDIWKPDELFSICNQLDISNNYKFHLINNDQNYQGQELENGYSVVMKREDFFGYITNNKDNGRGFLHKLRIHYHYKIPIKLIDFVSGYICNNVYAPKYNEFLIELFTQFVNAFMGLNDYPLIFDRSLSETEAGFIILSIFNKTGIPLDKIIKRNSDIHRKLSEVTGLFIFIYYPIYTAVDYLPYDTDDFTFMNKKWYSSCHNMNYKIVVDELICVLHSEPEKLYNILFNCGKSLFFSYLVSLIDQDGKIKLGITEINGASLIKNMVEFDEKAKVGWLLDELSKLKDINWIPSDIRPKLELHILNKKWLYLSSRFSCRRLADEIEKNKDDILRWVLHQDKTDKIMIIFQELVKHYNHTSTSVERYYQILKEFESS